MERHLRAIAEDLPGRKWQELFAQSWSHYRAWFLREGVHARPTYLESSRALKRYMPQLQGTYEQLVDLAGGGDIAARFLSLYRPTPYLSGCSQAAWDRAPTPMLVRNYDYSPALWDGTLLHSAWNGRRVMAMTDCTWGVLDGVSEAGLAVSLAFGGRRVVGDGFGIPLVLRYVLEFAENLRQAVRMVRRIPSHMAYNVTIVDRRGRSRTVHVGPDRQATVTRKKVATNHQSWIEWTEYVRATKSVERQQYLNRYVRDQGESHRTFIDRFLASPLYSPRFTQGWGTLYTAVYEPDTGTVRLLWPSQAMKQTFTDFHETSLTMRFGTDPSHPLVQAATREAGT